MMYARLVRYEVGQPENAESFVEEVLRQFDGMQGQLDGMCGSFLLTRPDEGEAIELTLWSSADAAEAAEERLQSVAAPDTGARELVSGRRGAAGEPTLWQVWQGRQEYKSD